MIKTNLLPPELQTKKGRVKAKGKAKTQVMAAAPSFGVSKPVFAVVVVAVLTGFLAGAGFAALKVRRLVTDARNEKATAEKARDDKNEEYQAEYKIHKPRLEQWEDMNEKTEILASLMPEDRLLWSEKFNMLSNLIPDGVYVTGLEITESITQQETQASLDKMKEWTAKDKAYKEKVKKNPNLPDDEKPGAKPKKSMKPIIVQTLVINALALWDEERGLHREKYIEFQKEMQAYGMRDEKGEPRFFKDGFRLADDGVNLLIVPGIQEKKVVDEVAVWAFKLTMSTKPFDAAKTKTKAGK